MSAGGPDLFVICKSCGSEVSPYITECPYCGNRLRKRAPKLDRDQRVSEKRPRRQPPPLLTRLRRDEIPGIRADRRPYATLVLLLAGFIGCLLWKTGPTLATDLPLIGKPTSEWWRVVTASFTYDNVGVAFVSLSAIALFGFLIERRHGPLVTLALFAVGGVGGLTVAIVVSPDAVLMGGTGAALALAVAWALPDLLTLRASGDVEGDLIGAGVFAAVVALMPLADMTVPWMADAVGVAAGLVIGLPLALAGER